MPEWEVVASFDWRTAHTVLGTTDLNFVGSSLTYLGVVFKTPSVARGNAFNQVACTTWRLEATGLRAVSPDNSRMNAGITQAPHVYATLGEIAANTATPFSPELQRRYMWQVFASVSAGTTAAPAESGTGAAIYDVDRGVTLGNAWLSKALLGRSTPINFCSTGVSVAPPIRSIPAPGVGVSGVFFIGSGAYIDFYAGGLVAGEMPFPKDMTLIASGRDVGTDNDNDPPGNSPTDMRLASVHNQEIFAPNAYDCTIQQSRLLRLGGE